jgi:hypothetical protein
MQHPASADSRVRTILILPVARDDGQSGRSSFAAR